MKNEGELMAIVKEGDLFKKVGADLTISKDRIEPLKEPALILEVGKQYMEKEGKFSHLGKIPDTASIILVGEKYRLGGREVVSGVYYKRVFS